MADGKQIASDEHVRPVTEAPIVPAINNSGIHSSMAAGDQISSNELVLQISQEPIVPAIRNSRTHSSMAPGEQIAGEPIVPAIEPGKCGACINHKKRMHCQGCPFTPLFPMNKRYIGARRMERVVLEYADPIAAENEFNRLVEEKRLINYGVLRVQEEKLAYKEQMLVGNRVTEHMVKSSEHMMKLNNFLMSRNPQTGNGGGVSDLYNFQIGGGPSVNVSDYNIDAPLENTNMQMARTGATGTDLYNIQTGLHIGASNSGLSGTLSGPRAPFSNMLTAQHIGPSNTGLSSPQAPFSNTQIASNVGLSDILYGAQALFGDMRASNVELSDILSSPQAPFSNTQTATGLSGILSRPQVPFSNTQTATGPSEILPSTEGLFNNTQTGQASRSME